MPSIDDIKNLETKIKEQKKISQEELYWYLAYMILKKPTPKEQHYRGNGSSMPTT